MDLLSTEFKKRLENLRFALRKLRSSGAGHLQGRHKGAKSEFHGHRAYQPGDEIETIDWKAYARSDHLFVKEFRGEKESGVVILIDTSRSMSVPKIRFERALEIAALLCYVALSDGASVELRTTGGKSPQAVFRGARGIDTAFHALAKLRADESESAIPKFGALRKPRGRCQVVLLTDLLYETKALLPFFERTGNRADAAVLHVVSEDELHFSNDGVSVLRDAETAEELHVKSDRSFATEFAKQAVTWIEEYQRLCSRNEASFVSFDCAKNLEDIFHEHLVQIPLVG
ncbi:MAG: DUF58 domain-containing protein [Planctomycetes bacterium]|nr:DUF58 domain-containing protein [Planctomycetota bacterium]